MVETVESSQEIRENNGNYIQHKKLDFVQSSAQPVVSDTLEVTGLTC